MPIGSYAEFIRLNQDVPRLIFTEDTSELDDVPFLTDSPLTRKIYRQLISIDTIVQTEELSMRGVDYGTKNPKGVALLCAKPCTS